MILKLELVDKNMEISHHIFDSCVVLDPEGNVLTHYDSATEGQNEVIVPDVIDYTVFRGEITVRRRLLENVPLDTNRRKIRRHADVLGAVLP